MPDQHSLISPSGLHRIMGDNACPASVLACKDIEQAPAGEAAVRGTQKHLLAEVCLNTGFDTDDDDVIAYCQYVRDLAKQVKNAKILVEHRVSLEDWVQGMFGTADAVVYGDGQLHVIDLKTGSERVDPNSPQLKAYALGCLDSIAGDFKSVHLHVAQPPINNFAEYIMKPHNLYEFGSEMASAAKLAMSDDRYFNPNQSACKYCAFSPKCKALHDQAHEIAKRDFSEPPSPDSLTDEQLARVVELKPMIEAWLRNVYRYAIDQVQKGETLDGLKLIAGRTQRKWRDDAEEELTAYLGADAFEKKLIGITKAEKLLDKKTVDKLTYKPAGSPSLVPVSDKRQALNPVADDFVATQD